MHLPPKKSLKQEVFGPHNTVDRLVWGVANGAYWIRLGSLLRLTLKALSLAT